MEGQGLVYVRIEQQISTEHLYIFYISSMHIKNNSIHCRISLHILYNTFSLRMLLFCLFVDSSEGT